MKCTFIYLITITLISATIPKDICDSCVPSDQCLLFGNLSKRDQQLWMERFPCRNQRNRYSVPPGFAATAKGDYVCCSNNIWGLENSGRFPPSIDSLSSKPFDENSPGYSDQDGMNYFVTNNRTEWYPGRDQNYNNNNYWLNNNSQSQTKLNNNNIASGSNANRWTNNRNRYWNERPGSSRNYGNQNMNNGRNNNNRQDQQYGNENNHRINQRPPYGNNYNYITTQRPPSENYRPRQPNNFNNQGYGRNPNDFVTNKPYSTTPNYPNNNDKNNGNPAAAAGQCERLTSFPPDPQSNCCGRELADDDRITDKKPHFAPANPSWVQPPFYRPNELWRLNNNQRKRAIAAEEGKNNTTVRVENRISGGKATELYQYPWTVLLLTTFDYGNRQAGFNCGGSLISAKYVLSAGHCVYDKNGAVASVEVYLAEYDKRTFPRDCKVSQNGRKCIENKIMYAENIILHPRYENENLLNDISLIRLQGTAPYTEYIRPICLPSINIDEPQFSNLQFEVAGWGRNGQYRSDVKQSTVLHLVNQNECKRFYPMLTTKHLCAAGNKGEDTCKGDSGGPLMTLYRGRYYVTGVVSGKRADSPCGTAVPSLYTNVYHYLDWIRNNIRN